MTFKTTLLAASCVLSLAACGKHEAAEESTAPAAPATVEAPAPATTAMPAATTTAPPAAMTTAMPAAGTTAAPTGAMADTGKPPATVKDCATTITGSDAMQYDVGSITIPASCSKFTINLKHGGTMAATAMGHNVVITKASDVQAVDADGMAAGAAANYIKPGDTRVIAHTKVVGGGESTSVSFDPKKLKDGGPYEFFCSFPGHATMMHGTISVG